MTPPQQGHNERKTAMKNEMLETVRRWLKSFSTLAAVCTVPFVVVSILQVDFLSVWRMALAYAIAVFSRQGFRLMFGEKGKVPSVVVAFLMFVGVSVCAAFVAWRSEHWAICGCGRPLDYVVPARLYPGPIVSSAILVAAALCCEHDAFHGKRGIVAKFIFYAACVGIACFALNFVDN